MSTPNTSRAAKPAARPAAKSAAKPATRTAAKPAAKPVVRAAAKPAARPAAKATVKKVVAKAPVKKVAAKAPAKKTVAKPAAKPVAKPATSSDKVYKLLTGVDDGAFCQKVSDHVEAGWQLYGSPSIVLKGGLVYAAQAVTRKPKPQKKGKKK
jgi:hypothetical protein